MRAGARKLKGKCRECSAVSSKRVLACSTSRKTPLSNRQRQCSSSCLFVIHNSQSCEDMKDQVDREVTQDCCKEAVPPVKPPISQADDTVTEHRS